MGGRAVIVVVAVLAAACSATDDNGSSAPARYRSDGASATVSVGPNSGLTAVVALTTDAPSRPRLVARSGRHQVEVPAPDEAATRHRILVVGLRPDRIYRLLLRGDAAVDALPDLTFRTSRLPADLPSVEAVATRSGHPGFTLFNASTDRRGLFRQGYLLAVDAQGEVVWYHRAPQPIADARQLDDGTILYNYDSTGARRINAMGEVVEEWTTTVRVEAGATDNLGLPTYGENAVVLDTARLHHEVAHRLDNGNYLALGMEIIDVDGSADDLCRVNPYGTGPRPLRTDLVLEYAPDGEIVRRLSLADVIDPVEFPGTAQCDPRTDAMVYGEDSYVDWSHANSAEVFADENLLVVSARNLNAVLGIRWEDDADGPAGELLWHLGPDGDFELTDGEWFYGQHAPERQLDGTWLIYDNGLGRPGTPDGPDGETGDTPSFSRAVVYEVDVEARTAAQLREYRATEPDGTPTYADFLGDADAVAGGNILITHGAVPDPDTDLLTGRILEVDGVLGAPRLDIRVHGDGEHGWRVYRAEHLDSLTG